ncbi:wax ester/triacylglycerol synthase domain-containing protein [Streptomyces tailanensis]|uniref:wax ester/triacylglycerol synthase domain-containing protein n=1 Tax=Streptomyces tailanensis TaxID=2569858 RepID=UPI00122E50F7|nr:wax ester/triacylglycerol synthase domain-containing protein [Streptomyces tailanensis]
MAEPLLLSAVEGIHASHTAVPQTFAMVGVLAGEAPAIGALRERAVERWGAVERLRWVLPSVHEASARRDFGWGRQRWRVLDRFDPVRHVVTSDDSSSLADLAGPLVGLPLPRDLPPWRLRVIRLMGTRQFALALVVHHALMDGASARNLFNRLLDGPSSGREDRRPVRSPGPVPPSAPPDAWGGPRTALELLNPSKRLPVHRSRARGEAVWIPVDPGALGAAQQVLPGSVVTRTEVLLSAAAGALRTVYGPPERWPGRRGAPVYAGVPVDLRSDPGELGNVLSGLRVPLPVGRTSPRARLADCRGLVAALRADHAPAGSRLLDVALRAGTPALRALGALMPILAPVGCTAMGWKGGPWFLDGRPLVRMVGVPTLSVPGTLYFMLVDYAGTPSLCVVANALPGQPTLLATAFARELDALTARETLARPR